MTPIYPLLAAMAIAACNPVSTLTPEPDCEVTGVQEVTTYTLNPGVQSWETTTYLVTMADGRRVILSEEEGKAIQADPLNACEHLEAKEPEPPKSPGGGE